MRWASPGAAAFTLPQCRIDTFIGQPSRIETPMTADVLRADKLNAAFQRLVADAPLGAWVLLALAAYVSMWVATGSIHLSQSLGDTDDATRLVQVREFLAGASWFDTTLARFGGPHPLLSHWSRLIDLPLATLLATLSLFMPDAMAETAVRAIWPLTLLAALLWVLARTAEERAGRIAGLFALLLTIWCFSGVVQFSAGRIDHHNAMNLAAVSGIIFLAGSFANPLLGRRAGAFLGLGMAVGYEALPITAFALAAAGLFAAWTGRGREGVGRAVISFAAILAVAFIATTAPSRWLDVRCDALSLNVVALAIVAGGGLASVLRFHDALTLGQRLIALAATGGAGLALFGALEPACLAGPFGQVEPAVYPIWLSLVMESMSFIWLFKTVPATALAIGLHVVAGLVAAAIVLRKDRDDAALFYFSVFLATVILSIWQVKLIAYVSLLAILPLAIAISRLEGIPDVSRATVRACFIAVLNQFTLLLISTFAVDSNTAAAEAFRNDSKVKQDCVATGSISALAALPKGLVIADVDMGPFIVALSPHDVLAAPYHRLDKAIIESHAILIAPPAEAERRLRALGATYVVTCAMKRTPEQDAKLPAGALQPLLADGKPPAFLEPVTLSRDVAFKVYKLVKPSNLQN